MSKQLLDEMDAMIKRHHEQIFENNKRWEQFSKRYDHHTNKIIIGCIVLLLINILTNVATIVELTK